MANAGGHVAGAFAANTNSQHLLQSRVFLREAWIASNFAKARNADQVRLVSDEWPDFELRFGNVIEKHEAVEAVIPTARAALNTSRLRWASSVMIWLRTGLSVLRLPASWF